MSSERISDEKAADIEKALKEHCRFLAYVRVNALLHDCDKSFAQFLLWSLLPGKERPAPQYDEHNKSKEPGKASVKRKEYLQYWKNSVIRTAEDLGDDVYIPFPVASCYVSYSDDKNNTFTIAQEKTTTCRSIYDFSIYHHDRPDCIEEANGSTALLLFIASVGGIDGYDTGYETEMEAASSKGYSGHHAPDTAHDNIVLISTPFGFERAVDLGCAEISCHFNGKITTLVSALRTGHQPIRAVWHGWKNNLNSLSEIPSSEPKGR